MDGYAVYTIAGCTTAVVINVAVVAYGYGRIKQKVDDIFNKQDKFEKDIRQNVKDMSENMKSVCQQVGYLQGRMNSKPPRGT